MLNTETLLLEKGEQYLEAVRVSQRQKGLRASGYSAANTRVEVKTAGHLTTLRLIGPAYWYFQQHGRRPGRGKRPPLKLVEAITAWTKQKGVDIPPYAIAMKIHRDGILVPNPHNPGGVLSEALNVARITSELRAQLLPALTQSLKTSLFS